MDRLFTLDAQFLFDAVVLAISMFVMFTFLSYLLFEPARKLLETRRQHVLDDQESAKREKEEAAAYKDEYAARIIQRGNTEIELEKKRALDDMKQEIISIASMMAGKVVTASIDTNVQDDLIEETLKEMGDSTWLS